MIRPGNTYKAIDRKGKVVVRTFSGSRVLVTGGASGIGRSICRTFAERGATVMVADRREKPRKGGTPTHELLREKTDTDARFIRCDVSEPDDIEAAVDESGDLDVMVNNAGIFKTQEFFEVDRAAFDEMFATNARSAFFGAQAAAKRMLESGSGAIVNISSTAALTGSADRVAYGASKAAIKHMTYSLADRLGPEGIRVNAVLPGLIDTRMADWAREREQIKAIQKSIPSRRLGVPENVATAVAFLAGPEADYVNGETLVVDGGGAHT